MMVFLNWVWAYFTYGLGARLITGRQRQDWTGGGQAADPPADPAEQ